MSGIFSDKIGKNQQSIAVIGASSTGSITAALLAALGIGPITILEANGQSFDSRNTSTNSVGTLHHLAYGGSPETMVHLFKAGLLFREMFPDHVFSDDALNYVLPAKTPSGESNSAIRGEVREGVIDERLSLEANLQQLTAIYREYIKISGRKPYGEPEDFFKWLTEEDLQKLLGNAPPAANHGKWLVKEGISDTGFVKGVQIKQAVLNAARFAVHMVKLLEKLQAENDFHILTNHKVKAIRDEEGTFAVDVETGNGSQTLSFDNVINAGYAQGIGITTPDGKGEGAHVALKAFGLFRLPAERMADFKSIMMLRGWFGHVVKVGPGLVAIASGQLFDRDKVTLPGTGPDNQLPETWQIQGKEPLGMSHSELLRKIQEDLGKYIPWVNELEPVGLRFAPHTYPITRAHANVIEAAFRRDQNIADHFRNKNNGHYLRLLSSKMTIIPYEAVETALTILSSFVEKGILQQAEVDKHIRIDKNGYVHFSEALQNVWGKNIPSPEFSIASQMLKDRRLPPDYLAHNRN